MTAKHLQKVAKLEMAAWRRLPDHLKPLLFAILFAFIHRVTTGETVEETFFKEKTEPVTEYEI